MPMIAPGTSRQGAAIKAYDRRALRGPDSLERAMGWGALAMLVAIFAAVARANAHWREPLPQVWVHLLTVIVALALTPAMLWSPRGTPRHRLLGYAWCAAMLVTALTSMAIRQVNNGRFSVIHILSVYVLLQLVLLVQAARSGNIARHRRCVRGLVLGGLLIAGFFTFPFHRMLGDWLMGG